jgi:hypothetical protein
MELVMAVPGSCSESIWDPGSFPHFRVVFDQQLFRQQAHNPVCGIGLSTDPDLKLNTLDCQIMA